MRNLIICECPSNEATLFGNLIISRSHECFDVIAIFSPPGPEDTSFDEGFIYSCNMLGIRNKVLFKYTNTDSVQDIEYRMMDYLADNPKYDRVYTHNPQTTNKKQQTVSSLTGKIFKEDVWILSGAGAVDEIVKSDTSQFSKILFIINTYYYDLLAYNYISINDIKNASLFQMKQGIGLYRYHNGCQTWGIDRFDYLKPWELEVSAFERARYQMELDALHMISWKTIIEVGACEGYLTKLLLSEFPMAQITAIEPDKYFFGRLSQQIVGKAFLINDDIRVIERLKADVIFISNVLYYLKSIPEYLFSLNAKYFVVCHDLTYHKKILDKEFDRRGFSCVYENNLSTCLEKMEGMLTIKYGANIKIWTKVKKGE